MEYVGSWKSIRFLMGYEGIQKKILEIRSGESKEPLRREETKQALALTAG